MPTFCFGGRLFMAPVLKMMLALRDDDHLEVVQSSHESSHKEGENEQTRG